ncbi:two-component response receiver and regulator protein [Desulforapulum autotrophicum HRM2]|uniref:Two-component response receiver and regulator protein n=1 Tax=Desulforapulum autotrophicum (strain ATCC 43914 / DSM 3382 / VKM B-1955 / HRM2) TaxID=177437 RepID=C0QH21_DESAH|nr:response regulator [Desulforapulum autotrophicum]ACN15670.1 two-component response receiver and regulator protein [Desulforapulum autotrophicum HRM2]
MKNTRPDIIIVDDNPHNLRVLSTILKKEGYEIRPATGGQTALAAIDAKPPELILLDIMMPAMNGYEVCECLKKNEGTRNIPVIFITALDDVKDKIKAFAMGCTDYISKPFQEEEILARVKTQIHMGRLQQDLRVKNERLKAETQEKDALILELQAMIDNVKVLSGLLPICANCKKIRSDEGYWEQIESYIQAHTEAVFSHGICPDCMKALYGDQRWYKEKMG